MDIRSLRYFVSVAQLGSFTKAAEVLNIAQPALSRQIRNLEDELGRPLLTRHARGVVLTDSGALLLARAEEIIHLLRQTTEDVKAAPELVTGSLTLGVPPATGLMLVPELMRRFRQDFPHVALNIREGIGSSLVEWTVDRRLDLAVVHNPPRLPELAIAPLVSERMVLVLPALEVAASWPQPKGERIGLKDTAELPLILPSHPHTNRLLFDSAMSRSGEHLIPAMEVDSVAITKTLVAEGLGATILTYAAIHQDVEAGRLRFIAIDNPPLISTLSVIRLKDHALTAASKALVHLVNETMAFIVRKGTWQGALSNSSVLRSAATSQNG